MCFEHVANRFGRLSVELDFQSAILGVVSDRKGVAISTLCGRYGLFFRLFRTVTCIFSRILHVSLCGRRLLLLGIHSGSLRPGIHQDGHSLIRNGAILPQDPALLCRGHRVGSRHTRLAHGAESGCYLLHGQSVRHILGGSRLENRLLLPVAFLCGDFGRRGFICPCLLGSGFRDGFRGFRGLLGGRIIDYIRKRNVLLRLQLLRDLLQQLHVALALGIGDIGNTFSLSLMQNCSILPNELDQLLRGDLLTPTLAHPLFQLLRHLVVGIQFQCLTDKCFLNALAVDFTVSLTETVVIPRNGDIVRN